MEDVSLMGESLAYVVRTNFEDHGVEVEFESAPPGEVCRVLSGNYMRFDPERMCWHGGKLTEDEVREAIEDATAGRSGRFTPDGVLDYMVVYDETSDVVTVRFNQSPPREVLKAIRSVRLRWNKQEYCWQGRTIKESRIREVLDRALGRSSVGDLNEDRVPTDKYMAEQEVEVVEGLSRGLELADFGMKESDKMIGADMHLELSVDGVLIPVLRTVRGTYGFEVGAIMRFVGMSGQAGVTLWNVAKKVDGTITEDEDGGRTVQYVTLAGCQGYIDNMRRKIESGTMSVKACREVRKYVGGMERGIAFCEDAVDEQEAKLAEGVFCDSDCDGMAETDVSAEADALVEANALAEAGIVLHKMQS